jgi:hypothetical protein
MTLSPNCISISRFKPSSGLKKEISGFETSRFVEIGEHIEN